MPVIRPMVMAVFLFLGESVIPLAEQGGPKHYRNGQRQVNSQEAGTFGGQAHVLEIGRAHV